MSDRPEPNVDALVKRATNLRLDGWENAQAVRELAALARANTTQALLLHDAMDALGRARTAREVDALFARYRDLTGTDTQETTAWGPDHPSYDEMGQ